MRGEHLGLGLRQLVLVLVLLDREQEVALVDESPVLVMELFEIALDPRDQLDRIDGSGIAGIDIAADALRAGVATCTGGEGC